MQEQKCGRSSGADDHRLGCGIREKKRAQPNEQTYVDNYAGDDRQIVETLLTVPADGLVLMTHVCVPAGGAWSRLNPGPECRSAMPLRKRSVGKTARTRQIAGLVLRSG